MRLNVYVTGIFILCVYVKRIRGMPCRDSWQEYNGTCYLRYTTNLEWKAAMATCRKSGNNNYLVTIDNTILNTFIHQNITNSSDVWLGLTNGNVNNIHDWTWSDGQPVTYIDDWNGANVNSLCVIMKLGGYKTTNWHTQICTYTRGFVCEKEMVNHTCGNMPLDYETHCYLVISEIDHRMKNMAAARYCLDQGAYLVSINNRSEAEFLYKHIQPGIEYWIGLSPLKWLDGTPFQYNNWDDIGPNKDASCVYMNHTSGKWSSVSCEGIHRFVCQEDIPELTPIPHFYKTLVREFTTTHTSYEATSVMNHDEMETYADNGISEYVLYPAFITALAVTVIGLVIVIICVCIYFKRQVASLKSTTREPTIYYNEVLKQKHDTKARQDSMGKTRAEAPSTGPTTGQNTYEHISKDPYVNSKEVTAGQYATLQ